MSHVEKSALVPYSAAQMYVLVDDCERYPEFLPWCSGAQTPERDATRTLATLHIDYRGIRQSFTTENFKTENAEIRMTLREGPFSQLDGTWRFLALSEGACKVTLVLDYGFSSPLLEKAVGPVFGMIANTMIERFIVRAEALYGDPV